MSPMMQVLIRFVGAEKEFLLNLPQNSAFRKRAALITDTMQKTICCCGSFPFSRRQQ
jgi:hypothetical protein